MKAHNIQKKVSYISAGSLIIVVVGNILSRSIESNHSFQAMIAHPNIWLLFLLALLLLIIGSINHGLARIIQVLIFICFGIFAMIWNSPSDLTGEIFIVISVILATQYNFLKSYPGLKFFFIGIIIITALVFSFVVKKNVLVFKYLGSLIVSVSLFLIFWALFSEDIKEYLNKNIQLEKKITEDKPATLLGRKYGGILHNLKNPLFGIRNYIFLIKNEEKKSVIFNYSHEIEKLLDRCFDVIDNIKFSFKTSSNDLIKKVNLNQITNAVLEWFLADQDFSQKIKLIKDYEEIPEIELPPLIIIQMIENLIQNAREALEDEPHAMIKIKTGLNLKNNMLYITVMNNGKDFSQSCLYCKKENCNHCKMLKIGFAKGNHKSGLGLIYIKEEIKKINGHLIISCTKSKGSEISLEFPIHL